jgi:hypothetical protein
MTADHDEEGFQAVTSQGVEQVLGNVRDRAVVEGQRQPPLAPGQLTHA